MRTLKTTWNRFANATILLGHEGEHMTGRVVIDVRTPLAVYPDAVFTLRVHPPGGEVYPAAEVERDGGLVTWTFTASDTALAGEGTAQMVMYSGGEEIGKTGVAHTMTLPSVLGGTPPGIAQDWIDKAEKLLADLENYNALPAITEADNGKVLTAVNGEWKPQEPIGGSGGGGFSFTDEELLETLVETDTLTAVESDGGILTEENNNILLM